MNIALQLCPDELIVDHSKRFRMDFLPLPSVSGEQNIQEAKPTHSDRLRNPKLEKHLKNQFTQSPIASDRIEKGDGTKFPPPNTINFSGEREQSVIG